MLAAGWWWNSPKVLLTWQGLVPEADNPRQASDTAGSCFMERTASSNMETLKWMVCGWFYFSSWNILRFKIFFVFGGCQSCVSPFFNSRCLPFTNQTSGVYLTGQVEGDRGPWWEVAWHLFFKIIANECTKGSFRNQLDLALPNRMPKMDVLYWLYWVSQISSRKHNLCSAYSFFNNFIECHDLRTFLLLSWRWVFPVCRMNYKWGHPITRGNNTKNDISNM